ncbi:signal peptidase I [Actinacidiphila sp. ITFR-21]|uniref:signal peptidase I n=1 Tax=Actinacidiphila sp. ITFR-21 TaxID=3075199 RepID=UPI00288A22C7|nr:signal peptidase I [Streptomyces sp. ITFR-21]WNI18300.1 signal peptidase I [Streptomyces sp. ITFR-21]
MDPAPGHGPGSHTGGGSFSGNGSRSGGGPHPGSGSASGPDRPASPSDAPPPAGSTRIERRRLARKIKRRRRRSLITEVPLLVLVALLIALVLKTFLLQAFVIPSGSMEQTIQIGDRVLVDKLTPWFGSKPQRGDVVVFKDPGGWLTGEPAPKPSPVVVKQVKQFLTFIGLLPASGEQDLIKRVIAVGGDTVECCDRNGHLLVNGKPLDEPYLYPGNPPSMMKFTVHVPPGRLWVMGDHRSDSADSRYHTDKPGVGTIPEKLVVGRAFVIAWPIGHWARLREPGTFSSVPDPPARNAAATGLPTMVGSANGRRTDQLPTPAELPLVMGLVGLRRSRGRRKSEVRSGRGGPRGRRTVWIRRTRKGGCRGTAGAVGSSGAPGAPGIRSGRRSGGWRGGGLRVPGRLSRTPEPRAGRRAPRGPGRAGEADRP